MVSEQISPEQMALNDLVSSELASELYLEQTIPLFHLLTTIYRQSIAYIHSPIVEINWAYDEILVTCGVNHPVLLQIIRQKLESLTFVPDGWTVFFELENDSYHLDSLSLINTRNLIG